MATYVVGDIQGCFNTFQSLLVRINFKPPKDRLIVLGDAMNRGPRSLEVLRYIMQHEEYMSIILGNHEIFAIALMLGALSPAHAQKHTLQALLEAPEAPKLVKWLQSRPILIAQENNLFVHAGLLPDWSIACARVYALQIQEKLMSTDAESFLREYFLKPPEKLSISSALASFTRMRMCVSKSIMDLSYAGTLADAPAGLKPWFMLRDDGDTKIFFGHWAALGLYNYKNYYCLDSGCGWGRRLTALCLEDRALFQVDNCD